MFWVRVMLRLSCHDPLRILFNLDQRNGSGGFNMMFMRSLKPEPDPVL